MLSIIFSFIVLLNAHQQDIESEEHSFVTCGSMIKLENMVTGSRLHSHQVTYGSGSGQQSVTGFPEVNDPNSLWIIRAKHDSEECLQGSSIAANSIIRLQHYATGCLLHSHYHQSPLSREQEVSCYGKNGYGDTGDNWKVLLPGSSTAWKRLEKVQFQHVDTGKFLAFTDKTFGNPIPGQREVACVDKKSQKSSFKSAEGYFFPLRVN
eukprot:TRINITY_DN7012_c0_g2_i4.p1 TRINITY_DN7012_c0_g2~~TRINITY_DN7012_c0_g2_i4.p1  ORF type:complete len:208 (-),score=32.44 TRINITY_DN7012_c0_g2_i4:178-801(-)